MKTRSYHLLSLVLGMAMLMGFVSAVPVPTSLAQTSAQTVTITVEVDHLCDSVAVNNRVPGCNKVGNLRPDPRTGTTPWRCNVTDPQNYAPYDASLNYGCNTGTAPYPYPANPATLDIEEYLYGVVPSEASVTVFPREAKFTPVFEAQSVAARTYALQRSNSVSTINNSITFQAFIPNSGEPLISRAVDNTRGEYLVADADYRAGHTGSTYAIDAEFSSDHTGDWTVTGNTSYLSPIYDPQGVGGGNNYGLSQIGMCRWIDGNTPDGMASCTWNGVSSQQQYSVRPTWTDYRQLLFHYYTGVQLVNAHRCVDDSWRWNPIEIQPAARASAIVSGTIASSLAPTMKMIAGQQSRISILPQNTGTVAWPSSLQMAYWWEYSTGLRTLPTLLPQPIGSTVQPGEVTGGSNPTPLRVDVEPPQSLVQLVGPGTFTLVFDLVIDPATNPPRVFENGRCGVPALRIPVDVQGVQAAPLTDTALIIDSSGSMSWNDPTNKRLAAAKAYLTAALPGDNVGVIDFDSFARVASPLLPLPENKTRLTNAINTIDASGGTNIGAGIQAGCNALIASSPGNQIKAAILLTDGDGAFLNQDACFKEDGRHWPIYTFGFGASNDTLLQQIATNTGGEFSRLPTSDMVCEFQRVRAKIAGLQPAPCLVKAVYPRATTSFLASVPAGQAQATFSTSWPGSDVVMTLVTPSGRVIDRTTVAPDVTHDKGATFEVYSITNPESGSWQVRLYGADVPAGGEDVTFGIITIPADPAPIATIDGLIAAAERSCASGGINHAGLCNSLAAKLRAAKDAIERKQFATARNQLNAFVAELDAQKEKKVDLRTYDTLSSGALKVMNALPQ